MGSKERGKPERSTAGSTGGRNTGRQVKRYISPSMFTVI